MQLKELLGLRVMPLPSFQLFKTLSKFNIFYMSNHLTYLKQALELAELKRGFCAPNPAVGAVIVKEGHILATGYHRGAGHPHAEVEALRQLSAEQSIDATLYVTLEPCAHYGRTPPCTELLIKHKIKAVYYGFKDPNPLVSGKGEQQLIKAGIFCQYHPLKEIDTFYQSYNYWTHMGRPWIIAKLAMSLDGKIAGYKGQRITITGDELHKYTHQCRKHADAILTTARTILHDDPQLNVRIGEKLYKKPVYVLDTELYFPLTAHLLKTAQNITIFHSNNADASRREMLESLGIRCVSVSRDCGKLSLNQVLEYIGQDGVHDLWVEAGGTCFQSFVSQSLAHQALIYMAPKWLGENAQLAFNGNLDLSHYTAHWRIMGNDMLCEFSLSSS